MHKDVKTNGNMTSFPLKDADVIKVLRNDDVMFEFVVPYEDAEFKSYLSRLQRSIEYK